MISRFYLLLAIIAACCTASIASESQVHNSLLQEEVDASTVTHLVQEHYEIAEEVESKLISSGDNDIYLVSTSDQKYIFRVYRSNKFWLTQRENYLFEMEWLNFLKKQDLPISYPIPKIDGKFLGTLDTLYWALFSFAPGTSRMSPELAEIFGKTVAEIHVASNDFHSTHPRHQFDLSFLLEDSLARLEKFLQGKHPDDLIYIQQLAKELKEQLSTLPFSGDDWGVIGGDFHGHNQHFTADNAITHFDFDLCGYGWRAYDIAVFRWARRGKEDGRWERFLEGYNSVRPLSTHELQSIPLFIISRQIWLMGAYTEHPQAKEWLQENWGEAMEDLKQFSSEKNHPLSYSPA